MISTQLLHQEVETAIRQLAASFCHPGKWLYYAKPKTEFLSLIANFLEQQAKHAHLLDL